MGDRRRQPQSEPFRQAPRGIHQQRARPHQCVPRANHRQFRLLLGRAMLHRLQQIPVRPRQLPRIVAIVLVVGQGDPLQLPRIGHDHFVPKLGELAGDPRRLLVHSHPRPCPAAKVSGNEIGMVAKRSFLHRQALIVEDEITAHPVAQIDPNRLGLIPLGNFAILLHGWFSFAASLSAFHSLSLFQGGQPSHPICPQCFAQRPPSSTAPRPRSRHPIYPHG
jgi:hypothetical protein